MIKNTPEAYGLVSKTLHWLSALLIVGLFVIGIALAYDFITDKALKDSVVGWHKYFGIVVLCLAVIRILWRSTNAVPDLIPKAPRWEQLAARSVHYLLYGLMFAVPLSGWVMATAANKPPVFFGFELMMPFVTPSKELADNAFEAHEIINWILLGALALHFSAALKHHFYNRDMSMFLTRRR
jgi:cytochrome b561